MTNSAQTAIARGDQSFQDFLNLVAQKQIRMRNDALAKPNVAIPAHWRWWPQFH
jgi:hypothetical protein